MDADILRFELFHMIMQANEAQLKDLKNLIADYLNSQQNYDEEWNAMPQFLKDRIEESLRQADAGLVTPMTDVIENTRIKYGLG